jgi:hypothetical protein
MEPPSRAETQSRRTRSFERVLLLGHGPFLAQGLVQQWGLKCTFALTVRRPSSGFVQKRPEDLKAAGTAPAQFKSTSEGRHPLLVQPNRDPAGRKPEVM